MFGFLSEKFSSLFSRFRSKTITQEHIELILTDVKNALLEADVPFDVVKNFSDDIQRDIVGSKLVGSLKADEQLMKLVYDRLLYFLGGASKSESFAFTIPAAVMVIGLQGSGKTTTLAKLAAYIKREAQKRGKARRILLVSVDFYRPAAINQLEVLAKKADIDFYRASTEDPMKAVAEIMAYRQKNSYEIVLLDTAGRLHVDTMMLAELQKISALIKPTYTFLVLDSLMGQESLNVARVFEREIGFTGGILTKMDSDARGGVAFAFRYVLSKPLLFVGTGEKITDFEPFRSERMASRIIGMGDILTLTERANEKIAQEKQNRMAQVLEKGNLTLQDFTEQIDAVSQLGSFSSLMKFIPGMGQFKLTSEQIEQGEVEMRRFKAIINSMTLKERLNPKILNISRKNRISRGAGVLPKDIDMLLAKFEQTQQFAKLFRRMGSLGSLFK